MKKTRSRIKKNAEEEKKPQKEMKIKKKTSISHAGHRTREYTLPPL